MPFDITLLVPMPLGLYYTGCLCAADFGVQGGITTLIALKITNALCPLRGVSGVGEGVGTGESVGIFQKRGFRFLPHPLPIKSRFGSSYINLYLCGR